jgi:hypothetical protein
VNGRDVAKVVKALVHGLADQPAAGPLLAWLAEHRAVPVRAVHPADLRAKARRGGGGLLQDSRQVRLVVPEQVCPQVVEHRVDGRRVLGPAAVEPDRGADQHVAEVAGVLGHRPRRRVGALPPEPGRHDTDGCAQLRGQGLDRLHGVVDRDLRVGQGAATAGVILGGPRREALAGGLVYGHGHQLARQPGLSRDRARDRRPGRRSARWPGVAGIDRERACR